MSKALYEIITSHKNQSFAIRKFDKRGFAAPFHFHPQFELTCITEGEGRRFVGNNMEGFQTNDLVLTGSNLPHCWKLNPIKNSKAGSIVIHFSYNFLGEYFFDTPEMNHIQRLLKRSAAGIAFRGKINEQVKGSMTTALNEKNDFKRLMVLLEILGRLSASKEYVLLNEKDSAREQSDNNRERINKVFAYIVDNFHNEISLDKAAQIIGMTPNAFCKYFKKITRKTFIETVIDYRINFATQQLTETDKTIAGVCFESGFGDMSHFYKMFTVRMKMSPLNYRKQFLLETKDPE